MPPRIFLAFSNKQDSYLEKLKDEFMFITGAGIDLQQAGKIDYVPLQDADSKVLFGRLAKWQKDITVFHYGGHAKSLYFDLRESQGQDGKYGINQLTTLLKGSQLKLVFLNGCSTKGMVQEVFNNSTARAVIEDNTASEFAKLFYDFFLGGFVGGMALQNAFDAAINHLTIKPEGVKRCSFSLKEIGIKDKNVKTLEESCPWRLFYRDEEILKWEINPGEGEKSKIEEGLRSQLDNSNENIENAFNALSNLKGDYALLRKFSTFDIDDDYFNQLNKAHDFEPLGEVQKIFKKYNINSVDNSIQKALEAVKVDIDSKRQELYNLYEAKNALLKSYYNQDKYTCIKKALFNINFDDQKIKVLSGIKREQAPIKAFILKGNLKSAHYLLIDCLSNKRGISAEVRIVKISFDQPFKSVSYSEDSEKALLKMAFQKLFPDSSGGDGLKRETIIQKIRLALASRHIVFVLDNAYEQLLKIEEFRISLEYFWKSLKKELSTPYEEFGELDSDAYGISLPQGQGVFASLPEPERKDTIKKKLPLYKVLLLVNLIKASKSQSMQGLPEDFSFLEEIQRIKPGYLKYWQNQTEAFLNFSENDYCEWFGEEGMDVLPTIEEICEKALGEEGRDFYKDNFKKYEYKEYPL